MALTDKNIVITPNVGQSADPKIVFSGADASTSAQSINLQVYPTNNGTLSFEGSAGQLFSITNTLSGTIFSVNDVSGIPSIEVLDTGLVKFAQYSGNILIGSGTDNGTDKVQITGSTKITGNLTVTGNTNFSASVVTFNDNVITLGGASAPVSDDNKDRGVEFNWHTGAAAKLGFYGWDDSASQFIFLSDATVSSDQYTGATISANYLALAPSASGTAPTFSSQGVDTDINIDITPKGAGDVNLNADTVRVGDSNTAATITTNGTGNLTLNTNSGTNSGTILINQGANGNITITPNGSGNIGLTTSTVVHGVSNTATTITTNGTGNLTLNTNSGTNAGSIVLNQGANANIDITPNGTGKVDLITNTTQLGVSNTATTLTTNGTGTLTVTTGGASNLTLSTNSGTNSSTIVINNGVNGNIDFTPNGTGVVKSSTSITATTGFIVTNSTGFPAAGALNATNGNIAIGGSGPANTISIGTSNATSDGWVERIRLGNKAAQGSSSITFYEPTTFNTTVVVTGDLTVNGTTTTVNSTTITVDDKNIELGSVTSPTNATADGGGITLKGATDKTIIWDNANTNWTSSENWNIATSKTFKVNNVSVLSDVAVLQNAAAASIGSLAAATTVSVGANNQNNILNINANGTGGTATLTTNVTTGTVNAFTGVTTGTINIGSGNAGKISVAFTTESTSTATGAVVIAGGLGVAKNISAATFKYNNGEPVGYTYDLDDISGKFNGVDTSFPLTVNDGTAVIPNNPNKIRIFVGGVSVTPTKYIYDFVNLPEVSVFNDGFIVSGSTIQFATPPLPGMSFYGTYRTSSDPAPTFKYKQAPFSAINIILR